MRNFYKKLTLITCALSYDGCYANNRGCNDALESTIQSIVDNASTADSQNGAELPLFSVAGPDKQTLIDLTNKSSAICKFGRDFLQLSIDIEDRKFDTLRSVYNAIVDFICNHGGISNISTIINELTADKIIEDNKPHGILVDDENSNENDEKKDYWQRVDWLLHTLNLAHSIYDDLNNKWSKILNILTNFGNNNSECLLESAPNENINVSNNLKSYVLVVISSDQLGVKSLREDFYSDWMVNALNTNVVEDFVDKLSTNCNRLTPLKSWLKDKKLLTLEEISYIPIDCFEYQTRLFIEKEYFNEKHTNVSKVDDDFVEKLTKKFTKIKPRVAEPETCVLSNEETSTEKGDTGSNTSSEEDCVPVLNGISLEM